MKKFKNNKGYTLLEILIGLFLTGLIAAAGFEFYATMHNQRLVQEDISDMQLNARNSLQEIVKTLRMGGYKISTHPPYRASGDSLFVFYSETVLLPFVESALHFTNIHETCVCECLHRTGTVSIGWSVAARDNYYRNVRLDLVQPFHEFIYRYVQGVRNSGNDAVT